MSYDGLVAGAIARQLHVALAGGRIEKIYQPEKDELLLHIHAERHRYRLLISANGNHARMHLTESETGNPQNPAAFCMLLRKHFQGGRISLISQVESERIINLFVNHTDELGFSVRKQLIVEIMGKHSNIIAVDAESGKILDSIKRITADVNRYRQLLPGLPYVPPPDQGKICLYTLTKESLHRILREGSPDLPLPKSLANRIQGLSLNYAGEICSMAAARFGRDVADLSAEELFPVLQDISFCLCQGQTEPVVYLDRDQVPVDFHVFPQKTLSGYYDELPFPCPSEAADYFFSHRTSSNRIRQKSQDLSRFLSGALDKLYLKKQRLAEDLLKAENCDRDRILGELLTVHLHEIPQGSSSISLFNYYEEKMEDIPLDPRYSPSKNAQRYFKKYAKAKTAIKEKNLQMAETDESINYLESVLTFTENAKSSEEIEDLRNELIEVGYLTRRRSSRKPAKSKLLSNSYKSSDGFRISVGRNNRDNDRLTFKTADKRDIWLHTKDIPGSHVILFTGGKQPTETAVLEAAALAAYYSKARNSENVPVDFTEARYVKKPAGAKPGMVIFTNNRTVFVNPKQGNLQEDVYQNFPK